MRWDKVKLPQPTEYTTSFYQTQYITSPNMTLQPRFGLSYLLNDRTVIRAGFGMYYTPFPMQLIDALFLGNGLYQTSISVNPYQSGAPVFSKVVSSATTIPNATSNIAFANTKFAMRINRAERLLLSAVWAKTPPSPSATSMAAACTCGRRKI